MSIKEVLRREQGEQRTMPTKGQAAYYAKERELAASYSTEVLNRGLAIQEKARVPQLLGELADVIRPDFPDVAVTKAYISFNGSVEQGIEWNSRHDEPNHRVRSELLVRSYPLTGNLVVISQNKHEILEQSSWQSDPEILEGAMVRAYRNPKIEEDNRGHVF